MKSSSLALALICFACLAAWVPAQAQSARPATKPAGDGKTLALGGGGTGGAQKPILTRDELRACLNTEAAIRDRIGQHEGARAPLDAERTEIGTEQEALRAERAKVDVVVAQTEAFKAKMEAHRARATQFNTDVAAFNDRPPTGAAGERERVRINKEREALMKAQGELEAERQQMQSANQALLEAYNARAKAMQERVADWNQKNSAWNEAGRKLEAERQAWVGECSDRRYREDDEIAIKAGR